MLEPGMWIKTNYDHEPCRVVKVYRDCDCSSYLDEIAMDDPPTTMPHIHVEVVNKDGKKRWLGRYDEKTLFSLDKTYCGFKTELGYDWIIVLDQKTPVQMRLF